MAATAGQESNEHITHCQVTNSIPAGLLGAAVAPDRWREKGSGVFYSSGAGGIEPEVNRDLRGEDQGAAGRDLGIGIVWGRILALVVREIWFVTECERRD